MKLQILTTPCSGKTYFCGQQNYEYSGVTLFDTDITLRPVPNRTPKHPIPQDAIDFLQQQTKNSCLLTSLADIGPDAPKEIPNVAIVAVILDEEILKQQAKIRETTDFSWGWAGKDGRMSSKDYWISLQRYADEHQIPIFNSFIGAIDYYVQTNI